MNTQHKKDQIFLDKMSDKIIEKQSLKLML